MKRAKVKSNYKVRGSSVDLSVSVPGGYGYTYSYTVNGGAATTLTNGQVNTIPLNNVGVQTKTVVITASYNGTAVGSWSYSIVFGIL